jgi:polyhydroxyalkanoate synthesis regulator phasin
MNEALNSLAAGVAANMYLGTEIAFRLVDVLVTKGVITKGEAAATLDEITAGIRNDAAADPGTREMIEASALTLEKFANDYRQEPGAM